MSYEAIIFGVIFFFFIVYIVVQFFSMTLNAFLEKTITKTLWLWLPFHALKRLIKEILAK